MSDIKELEVEYREVLAHAKEISKSKYTLNIPIVHTLEVMAELASKSEELIERLKE